MELVNKFIVLVRGFSRLTQLKMLHMAFNPEFDDLAFHEAIALTNLIDLSIYYNHAITGEAFKHITRLSNMKVLAMTHNKLISAKDLAALVDLPNLENFTVQYEWDDSQERFDEALAIFGQLSRLTSLHISHYEATLNFDRISQLTNLNELHLNARIEHADFSALSHVTRLNFQPQDQFKLKNLPVQLKDVSISNVSLNEEAIDILCSIQTLERLSLNSIKADPVLLANGFTRLTNLYNLTAIPSIDIGWIPALRSMDCLGSLIMSEVPNDMVPLLKQLTQLIELTYWDNYVPELHQNCPFIVEFLAIN